MLIDLIVAFALLCVVIGLGGFAWNASIAVKLRRSIGLQSPRASKPGKPPKSPKQGAIDASPGDRQLYDRAMTLVRENRFTDAARLLEELGLAREAAAILERNGLIHEAAGVFLRRKRYHRAGEVYARHRMWEQAGQSYLMAASLSDPLNVAGSRPVTAAGERNPSLPDKVASRYT